MVLEPGKNRLQEFGFLTLLIKTSGNFVENINQFKTMKKSYREQSQKLHFHNFQQDVDVNLQSLAATANSKIK